MKTYVFAIAILVGLHGIAAAQPAPRPLAKEIVAAWEDAGVHVGCTEYSEQRGVLFRWRGRARPGELPAVQLWPWRDGVLSQLPDPGVPFAFFLEGPCPYSGGDEVPEAGLKEVTRFHSLRYLSIVETSVSVAGLKDLATLPNLHTLDLAGTSISPAGVKVLAEFKALHTVTLIGDYFTAANLKELATLKKIRFGFNFNGATDEGLHALAGVENLHTLAIGEGNRFTEAGLSALEKMKGLKRLTLRWTPLSDAAMKEIGKAKGLEYLNLENSEMSVSGSRELAGLENLRELNLNGTRMRDAGLKSLGGLKNLRTLNLMNTRITNAGLAELAGLQELQSLSLWRLPLTDEGIRHLVALRGMRQLRVDTVNYAGPRWRAVIANPNVETLKSATMLADYDHFDDRSETDRPRKQYRPASFAKDFTDEKLRAYAQLPVARDITSLVLRDTQITDAGLAEMRAFKSLLGLHLEGTAVTDDGLKALAGMDLRVLRIPDRCWTAVGLKNYLAATRPMHNLKFGKDNSGPWKATDAGLKEIGKLKHLRSLDLSDCTQVTDEGIKELAGLTNLHTLVLYRTKLTDAGMKHLAGLKNLRTLNLEGTKVTAEGLKELTGMSIDRLNIPCRNDLGLRYYLAASPPPNELNLSWWKITDAGLKELAHLKNLHSLSLRGTQVTDAGLKELAVHKDLRTLGLGGTSVTGTGFKDLQGLTHLRELYLGEAKISDAGLKEIAGLSRLEDLGLQRTPVGDLGVKALGRQKHLNYLDLKETAVTDAGLAHLAGLKLRILEIPPACQTDLGLKHFLAALRPRTTHHFTYWKGVTDRGVKEMARYPHAHSICLLGTGMTEAGLKELAGFKDLESLRINIKLTDAVIDELARHKQLRYLSLGHKNATDADVKKLRAALPGCEISR